jgi:hypothetical protein
MSDDQFAEIMEREGIDQLLQRALGEPTVESLVETWKVFRDKVHPAPKVEFFCAKGEYGKCLDWLKRTFEQRSETRYEFGLGRNPVGEVPLYVIEHDFVRPGEVFLVVDGERKCHVRMWD